MTLKLPRREFTLGGLAAAGLAMTSSGSARAQDAQSFILATATTGGTYYPVGVALATLTKVKLEPTLKIGMSAISSAGSGENLKLMRENQAQFAIIQGVYGKWASTGTGPLESEGPQEWLRTVSMLWQNVEHFIVTNDLVDSGTIGDLAAATGASLSIGAKNSGTEGSGIEILTNLGLSLDDFEIVNLGYGPTADAMQNGNVKIANMPGGVPVSAITQIFATMGDNVTILDFTDEQVAKANGEGELWTRYVIPAESYPGQTKDVQTIAQPNFLGVRADVDEEAVYQITKTMYENLLFLQNIHKATTDMALDKAIAGLPAPLHAGAARFYEEAGITIPDRLKPRA